MKFELGDFVKFMVGNKEVFATIVEIDPVYSKPYLVEIVHKDCTLEHLSCREEELELAE